MKKKNDHEYKMLPLSPLQLKQHSFSALSVRANPKGVANAEPSLEPKIFIQKMDSGENEWLLGLKIILKSAKPELAFLYDIEAELQGVVIMNGQYAPERRELLAAVNGLSILYSSIREMVLILTSRSVHGALCLPALNFSEVVTGHLAKQNTPAKVEAAPATEQIPDQDKTVQQEPAKTT